MRIQCVHCQTTFEATPQPGVPMVLCYSCGRQTPARSVSGSGVQPSAPSASSYQEEPTVMPSRPGAPGEDAPTVLNVAEQTEINATQRVVPKAPSRPPAPKVEEDYVPFAETMPAPPRGGAPAPAPADDPLGATMPAPPRSSASRTEVPATQLPTGAPPVREPGSGSRTRQIPRSGPPTDEEIALTMPTAPRGSDSRGAVPPPSRTEIAEGVTISGDENKVPSDIPGPQRGGIRRVSSSGVKQPSAVKPPSGPRPASNPPAAAPPPPRSKSFAEAKPDEIELSGRVLNGYAIKRTLGAGGMGAVCLAQQISLDREVALKILPGAFADNADFLARFTREALSAAQLNHHNIVQVYDVGEADGIHFISMEYVKGDNLGAMTRKGGKLAIEDAAGYVLQVARGLQYAHERGIIHRDIKPENIMVNEHGVVKIMDLGLAKAVNMREESFGINNPRSSADMMKLAEYADLTDFNVAMGTPAYMAPEQGLDASRVDHRADQYSLGCTLYYLVAGKTPFTGKTTFEIISKHQTEPLIPVDAIVKNVPKELSYIVEKMLAKDPTARYPSLREVIESLESFLGIDSTKGPYTPREHHVSILEKAEKEYYAAASLKTRKLAMLAFYSVNVALMVLCAVLDWVFAAGFFLGLMGLTPVLHFLYDGFLSKSYFFRRVRSVFFGMSMKGWGITAAAAVVALVMISIFNLLLPWVACLLFAGGFAVAYNVFVVRKIRAERAAPLRDAQEMFKQLRVRGVSEEALQEFVYRFSQENWEEFFEELFGYEDMILMRGKGAAREKVRPRKRFAVWRDPIARWIDEVEESRRKAKERRELERAEKNLLKSQGMDEAAAAAEATKIAQKAMDEGLVKTAVIPAGALPSKADVQRLDLELAKASRRKGRFHWPYALLRGGVGVAIAGAYGLPLAAALRLTQLPEWMKPVLKQVFELGLGSQRNLFHWSIAAVVGVLLMLTLFSKRYVLPTLMLLAAVAMVLAYVVGTAAGVAPILVFWGCGLLVVACFSWMLFTKATGNDF